MGMFGIMTNRKKHSLERKQQKAKRLKKAELKKKHGERTGDITDDLMTSEHLKKRRTSPRSNITLSGKKKRKLLKQLKHMASEKERAENEMDVVITQTKNRKKGSSRKSTSQSENVNNASKMDTNE